MSDGGICMVWGRGGDGQLGHGLQGDLRKPHILNNLYRKDVSQLVCGGRHSVVVTSQGDIYSWGWNYFGQLGHGDLQDELAPKHIKSLALVKALQKSKFVGVGAGNDHTVALTNTGVVYSWGGGNNGQLGNGEGDEGNESGEINPHTLPVYQPLPHRILPLHNLFVVQIACGSSHTLCVTLEGATYSWGRGSNGRLGHNSNKNVLEPKLISHLEKTIVTQVACGWSHSLAVSDLGVVYSWGKGTDGQLGHNDCLDQVVPKEVMALTRRGPVYTSVKPKPIIIESLPPIPTIISTSYVENKPINQRLTGDISLAFFPKIEKKTEGQKDENENENTTTSPTKENGTTNEPKTEQVDNAANKHVEEAEMRNVFSKIIQVSGGYFHSAALTDAHELFTWGWGEYGQLGHGRPKRSQTLRSNNNNTNSTPKKHKDSLKPRLVKALRGKGVCKVACGGFHTIAITKSGEMYSWGQSDFGQLGVKLWDEKDETETEKKGIVGVDEDATSSSGSEIDLKNENDVVLGGNRRKLGNPAILKERSFEKILLGKNVDVPTLVELGYDAVNVSCGMWHTIAIVREKKSKDHPQRPPSYASVIDNYIKPHVVQEPALKEPLRIIDNYVPEIPLSFDATPITEVDENAVNNNIINNNNSDDDDDNAYYEPPKVLLVNDSIIPGSRPNNKGLIDKIGDFFKGETSKQLAKIKRAQEMLANEWTTDILPKWDEVRSLRRTKVLWRSGIPSVVRGEVWKKAVGNSLGITQSLYDTWVEHSRAVRKVPVPGGGENTFRMIEVDLPRTYPTLSLFNKRGPYHLQLREVLEAYAYYRPDIGYVQGMSYLAGMFLFYMESYDTFVCLANLLHSHFFISLYMMNIGQILRHVNIYNLIFARNLPDLYETFQHENVSAEQYLLDWFMTLFTKVLPVRIAHRIWDCVLLEGEEFVYRAALGIIKTFQKSLQNNFETCVIFLRSISRQDIIEEEFFANVYSIKVPEYIKKIINRMGEEVTKPP